MAPAAETVVLVHGLWVHGIVMQLMRRRVAHSGFRVFAYSYPSVRLTLAENAERLARYCREIGAPRLHFVGHSLGGLIVLRMLERASGIQPGRVVLAGVPVAGSYAALRLARLPGGHAALGRSMMEWLESKPSVSVTGCDIGVIAGRMPVGAGRIVAPELPGPNDGAVRVEETRLPAMRDHIVLNVSHSGMLISREVAHQVCAFLRDGRFSRSSDR
jgi:pimeloyl-ACP methyl ester carboxylesterase